MTSSRSASVLDGAICSSGISSPVSGSRYWIRLWCDSSVSSSMRIPVWRSTSTIAQVQKPRCSSKVRSRRRPPSGCSAQTRPVVSVFMHRAAQRLARGGEQCAGLGAFGGGEQLGGAGPFGLDPGDQRRQHRQPFPGALVHAGLAPGPVLLVGDVAGADRAAHRPRSPPGRVVVGPLGDVEVEGPHRRQHAAPVQPRRGQLDLLAGGRGRGAGAGHHPLLPCRGDLAGQLEGVDAGVVGLQVGPEQLARAGRRSVAARRSPPTAGVRAGSRPARRAPGGRRSGSGRSAARRSAARGRRTSRSRPARPGPGRRGCAAVGRTTGCGRAPRRWRAYPAATCRSSTQSPTRTAATGPPLAARMTAIRVRACCPVCSPTRPRVHNSASAANAAVSRVRAISAASPRRAGAKRSSQPRLGRITSAQISTSSPGLRCGSCVPAPCSPERPAEPRR